MSPPIELDDVVGVLISSDTMAPFPASTPRRRGIPPSCKQAGGNRQYPCAAPRIRTATSGARSVRELSACCLVMRILVARVPIGEVLLHHAHNLATVAWLASPGRPPQANGIGDVTDNNRVGDRQPPPDGGIDGPS